MASIDNIVKELTANKVVMTTEQAERLVQLEERDKKRKEYKKKWHQEWKTTASKEELDAIRTKERERKRQEREKMTDEEREAIRKLDRERKAKSNLSEAELERRRAYNREYKRKQREAKKAQPIADQETAIKELEKGTVVLK